jgi:hypothetical protein
MTSFQIDTGTDYATHGRINYCEALLDAAKDALPDDAAQEEIDAQLARLIVTDLVTPKTAKTARRHFARYWPLIAEMAETSPASFDHILTEFAERLGELR